MKNFKIILILLIISILFVSCRANFSKRYSFLKPKVYLADCSSKEKVKESMLEYYKSAFEEDNKIFNVNNDAWIWSINENDTLYFVRVFMDDNIMVLEGDGRFFKIHKSNCKCELD